MKKSARFKNILTFGGIQKNNTTLAAYIIKLVIFFIKFSKGNPERVRLSSGLDWIHSLYCLSVCVDDLDWRVDTRL